MLDKDDISKFMKNDSINIGFSHKIYLSDKYVLKICYNKKKEEDFLNEIEFYKNNHYDFIPKLVHYDISKKDIPYYYIVITRIDGYNLFTIWSKLNNYERDFILEQLKIIMDIIHVKSPEKINYKDVYFKEFDKSFDMAKNQKIFSNNQIKCLEEIRKIINKNFYMNTCYQIHGDLQFNNIMCTKDGEIKIIDFENVHYAPLEKEFYYILRMAYDPKSFLNRDNKCYIDEDSFNSIIGKIYELYPKICSSKSFEYNIFLFEILNALKWITKYPKYEKYHKILFKKIKEFGDGYEKYY